MFGLAKKIFMPMPKRLHFYNLKPTDLEHIIKFNGADYRLVIRRERFLFRGKYVVSFEQRNRKTNLWHSIFILDGIEN